MPDSLRSHTDVRARRAIGALLLCAACGCRAAAPDTALERLTDSRRLAGSLLVQLTKSADAGNRAVMAGSEERSAASIREAEQAAAAIERDVEALRAALQSLGYADEARLLDEFARRFAEYRTVDRMVLDLSAENTNLEAQQNVVRSGQSGGGRVARRARRLGAFERRDRAPGRSSGRDSPRRRA